MNPLEQQLLDLAGALDLPATPDLMAGVRAELPPRAAQRRRRRWRWVTSRRQLTIAIAVVVLLAGTAAAVPPVLHAVERLFGLNGAVVERVPRLPPLPKGPRATLHLGRRIPVGSARHAASFRALLPLRGVDAVYVAGTPAGGRITLAVGPSLVMEFRGQSEPFIEKLAGPGTRIRRVRVDGGRGVYLDRAPHAVIFENTRGTVQTDVIRREGAVLLWQHGHVILRIEGAGSLTHALALARSLR